jgi:hypothetical protein
VLPPEVREHFFVRPDLASGFGYRPGALLVATVSYKSRSVAATRRVVLIAPLGAELPSWSDAWLFEGREPPLAEAPVPGTSFADLPVVATRAPTWPRWRGAAIMHVTNERPLRLWEVAELKLLGTPGETRDAFAARLALHLRERRDAEVDALVAKWQPKIDKARAKVEAAARKIEDATADRNAAVVTTGLDLGATVLGAMFGRRSALRGAASVATKARRAQKRGTDAGRAASDHAEAVAVADQMEKDLEAALAQLRASWDPSHVTIGERAVSAKKTDVVVERFGLVWVPVAGG